VLGGSSDATAPLGAATYTQANAINVAANRRTIGPPAGDLRAILSAHHGSAGTVNGSDGITTRLALLGTGSERPEHGALAIVTERSYALPRMADSSPSPIGAFLDWYRGTPEEVGDDIAFYFRGLAPADALAGIDSFHQSLTSTNRGATRMQLNGKTSPNCRPRG